MAPGLAGQAAACCTQPCPAAAEHRRPGSPAGLAMASGEHPAPCLGAHEKVRRAWVMCHGTGWVGADSLGTVLEVGKACLRYRCLSWRRWGFSPVGVGRGMPPAPFRVGAAPAAKS